MNKRKIMMLALSLCMVAILAVGGTLAYFTDTDTATNTFTWGNVKIDLVEDYEQNSKLMPGEASAVKKSVTVKNETGSEAAYMWIELWIPAKLDDANAANNSLHFNPFDTYKDKDNNLYQIRGSEAKEKGYTLVAETVEVSLGKKTIGTVEYNGYREYIKNDTPKKAGESTYPLLSRVFADARVQACTEHDNCLILADGTTHYTGSWEIIVNAFGIQAAGFDNIETAIAAYNTQATAK